MLIIRAPVGASHSVLVAGQRPGAMGVTGDHVGGVHLQARYDFTNRPERCLTEMLVCEVRTQRP